MVYYYLKTTTKEELWDTLISLNLAKKEYDMEDPLNIPTAEIDWTPSGRFDYVFLGIALDEIGVIYTPTGNTITVTDSEGVQYETPETVPVDGYHANIITTEPVTGLPEIVPPNTPYRVWAGQ